MIYESVDESEDHIVQRLSARASHVIAAARQCFDAETRTQLKIAEDKGAKLVCVASEAGQVSVVLFDGAHVIAALYEVDGDGNSVVRALRGVN